MDCKKEAAPLMHKVLDEEATELEKQRLFQHIKMCKTCEQHFEELKKSITCLLGMPKMAAPEGFTAQVMRRLPKEKHTVRVKRWFIKHPILAAVAIFIFLSAGSLFTTWSENSNDGISVEAKDGSWYIDRERNVVVIPEGEVVKGDLIIRNGGIDNKGEVEGDVIIINNGKYMASVGKVTGQIEEVDAVLEWTWYQMKSVMKKIIPQSERNKD